MIKTFRFLLVAALMMVCGNMFAQDTEATATWDATVTPSLPTEIGNDINLTWIEASGDQAPMFSSSGRIVFFKNNKLTVAGADANVTISKIVFTFADENTGMSVTTGSYSAGTWTGEANSVTFTPSGKRYIKKIEVTYTGNSTVVKVPELVITKVDNFNTAYDMDATDNKTLVAYYANTGNAKAENAKLTLYVGGEENKVVEIGVINAGATDGWKNVPYDLSKIEEASIR